MRDRLRTFYFFIPGSHILKPSLSFIIAVVIYAVLRRCIKVTIYSVVESMEKWMTRGVGKPLVFRGGYHARVWPLKYHTLIKDKVSKSYPNFVFSKTKNNKQQQQQQQKNIPGTLSSYFY